MSMWKQSTYPAFYAGTVADVLCHGCGKSIRYVDSWHRLTGPEWLYSSQTGEYYCLRCKEASHDD